MGGRLVGEALAGSLVDPVIVVGYVYLATRQDMVTYHNAFDRCDMYALSEGNVVANDNRRLKSLRSKRRNGLQPEITIGVHSSSERNVPRPNDSATRPEIQTRGLEQRSHNRAGYCPPAAFHDYPRRNREWVCFKQWRHRNSRIPLSFQKLSFRARRGSLSTLTRDLCNQLSVTLPCGRFATPRIFAP